MERDSKIFASANDSGRSLLSEIAAKTKCHLKIQKFIPQNGFGVSGDRAKCVSRVTINHLGHAFRSIAAGSDLLTVWRPCNVHDVLVDGIIARSGFDLLVVLVPNNQASSLVASRQVVSAWGKSGNAKWLLVFAHKDDGFAWVLLFSLLADQNMFDYRERAQKRGFSVHVGDSISFCAIPVQVVPIPTLQLGQVGKCFL